MQTADRVLELLLESFDVLVIDRTKAVLLVSHHVEGLPGRVSSVQCAVVGRYIFGFKQGTLGLKLVHSVLG